MNADENNARWTKDRLKAILLGPVRWGTILFITVGLVVYVFLTAVADVGAVCHQELAGNPPSPTKVCGPPTVTDPSILVLLLLLVVLLAPSFSEIGIPGFLTLKSKVEAQERRQDELAQQIRMVTTQSVTTQVVLVDPATLETQLARADKKVRTLEARLPDGLSVIPPKPPEPSPLSHTSEERARFIEELLLRARILADWAASAQSTKQMVAEAERDPAQRGISGTPTMMRQVQWADTFAEELKYVEAARNAIAHGDPIGDETLRLAVRLARKVQEGLASAGLTAPLDLQAG